MLYLTGADNAAAREAASTHPIGVLARPGNAVHRQVNAYRAWAADNGCFSPSGKPFDPERWFAWLSALPNPSDALFAVAPDVVGDAVGTLERSTPWLARIRALGFKVAFVAQDGIENTVIPWQHFDVLFIGGSTEFKLSNRARRLTIKAHNRGKWVHMGRVNSKRRFDVALSWGVDSVDGTFLAFGPDKNLPRLLSWFPAAA
jgi:hypothetical protein